MSARRFMPVRVMHRLAVELCPMIGRMFSTRWKRSVISLSIIEMMINVAVKVVWPMEPRSGTDKDAA